MRCLGVRGTKMNNNKNGIIFIDDNMLIKHVLPTNFLLKSEKDKYINKKLYILYLLATKSILMPHYVMC